jgi:hypothetical protein
MRTVRTTLKVYFVLIYCVVAPLMAQSAAGAGSVVPGVVKFTGVLKHAAGRPISGTAGANDCVLR